MNEQTLIENGYELIEEIKLYDETPIENLTTQNLWDIFDTSKNLVIKIMCVQIVADELSRRGNETDIFKHKLQTLSTKLLKLYGYKNIEYQWNTVIEQGFKIIKFWGLK